MIFAALHACLGWALATLACFCLRRRSASVRCWVWRMGLLKGPLALLLAVPIVIARPAPSFVAPLVDIAPNVEAPYKSYKTYSSYKTYKQPIDPFPLLYGAGVVAVGFARLASARRVHRAMPRVEGAFRPRVIVPAGLTPEAAAMALAHEEAHVRRRDPQWSLLADAVCAALWFAPPVWLCARAMRAEAEAACDDAALQTTGASKKSYARLLLTFAGPAPANALGGPARRLARRIAMLDRNVKSLPRPAWALFIVVGLAVALPWQAIAQDDVKPSQWDLKTAPPFRIELKRAENFVFLQPGVKKDIGWTATQEAALEARGRRWQAEWAKYQVEAAEVQRVSSLNDWNHFTYLNRAAAEKRADDAAGPPVWTAAQEGRLKQLALQRFGGALWNEEEVVGRLRLTEAQKRMVLTEDMAIIRQISAKVPRSPKYPPKVQDLIRWTTAKYFAATPADRPALLKRINALTAPYWKTRQMSHREEQDIYVSPAAWKIRAEADKRLVAALTEEQRQTLKALTTDASAW